MNLSIIVPVYNMASGDKLKHCIDSLLNQDITQYEIIAVDDASTDNSLEVLRQYEKDFGGVVKVVASPVNQKQGGAKNRGLEVATGDWVGFVDSDDWVHPDMYKMLLRKAAETGADFVGCDYNRVTQYTFEVGEVIENNSDDQTGDLDLSRHKKHIVKPGSMVVKIYKRSVIEDNHLRFPEGIFYEDNMAAPIWSMYFTHFERVPEPYYYYYTVPSSTTQVVTWDRCLDRMKAAELMIEAAKDNGSYNTYMTAIDYNFTKTFYLNTLWSYMLNGGEDKNIKNIKALKAGILKYVPDFRGNDYYRAYTSEEDQKLVNMHLKSDLVFFNYFNMLFGYRELKKNKNKKGEESDE